MYAIVYRYGIVLQKGYQKFGSVSGIVTTKLKGASLYNGSYGNFSQNCDDDPEDFTFDVADYVIPPQVSWLYSLYVKSQYIKDSCGCRVFSPLSFMVMSHLCFRPVRLKMKLLSIAISSCIIQYGPILVCARTMLWRFRNQHHSNVICNGCVYGLYSVHVFRLCSCVGICVILSVFLAINPSEIWLTHVYKHTHTHTPQNQEPNSFFIMTNLWRTCGQKQDFCAEVHCWTQNYNKPASNKSSLFVLCGFVCVCVCVCVCECGCVNVGVCVCVCVNVGV